MSQGPESSPPATIAIIGMAGRFPGARSARELWTLVRDGREAIRRLSDADLRAAGVSPAEAVRPNYVRAAATLDDMDMFDAGFFGLSPRDGAIMDPQHRHFLECAWEVMEAAGYTPESFGGAVGVFGGCGMQSYFARHLLPNRALMAESGFFLLRHTGNDKDFLTTRVSYQLNLRGPSISVQTACSTSLVAVHLACQSLLSGECDMALAGGVTIELPHGHGYFYEAGGILSPDGHCRPFDAASKGTVFGSGVGLVALRRLDDAIKAGDHVHAVILGSAVNNDGAGKVGYLAPSVDGQAAVVAEALGVAGVEADSIGYIETHGTGTPVGDPIEVSGLTEAFRPQTNRRGFCAIGSVKSNIGHLDTAAGVASLIKAVSAVEHGEIPPSLHFAEPNPSIPFGETPFEVSTRLTPWTSSGPRRAGITALGVGGTNAHVIIEQAPAEANRSSPHAGPALLVLSARSDAALDAAASRLAVHLRTGNDVNLSDVAFTLQTGRRAFRHRLAVVASTVDEAVEALRGSDVAHTSLHRGAAADTPPVVSFLFPGGGTQFPGMGASLYRAEPVFREHLDGCLAAGARHSRVDLRTLITGAPNDEAAATLERPSVALPSLFAVEYALARLLESWGIRAESMLGHSMGEYVAACLAGVFTVDDGMRLVSERGRLFEQLPAGAMTSVPLSVTDIERDGLSPALSIAAANAPTLSVVSGPVDEIVRFTDAWSRRGIDCRRLRIAVAAHSSMLEPILGPFLDVVRSIRLQPPTVPIVSNVTGTWLTASQATNPQYWVDHLRRTVQFGAGVAELLADPRRLLLEVGPGTALSSIARSTATPDQAGRISSTMGRADDATSAHVSALGAAGLFWAAGLDVRPTPAERQRRVRVPLPTYPFERIRCWIEAPSPADEAWDTPQPSAGEHRDVSSWLQVPVWTRASRPARLTSSLQNTSWLIIDDGSPPANALTARLRTAGVPTTVRPKASLAAGTIDAGLTEALSTPRPPTHIVYMAVSEPDHPAAGDHLQEFFALLTLTQAMAEHGVDQPVELAVVTQGLHAVGGRPTRYVDAALAAGALRVVSRELPHVSARSIDLQPSSETGGDLSTDALWDELLARPADAEDTDVAFGDGDRWVRTFRSLPRSASGRGPQLEPGAVCLVTGGLGGIALTLCEELARHGSLRFVLAARSGFPARRDWASWLASHPADDPTASRIVRLQRIEALGSTVRIERADFVDPGQVDALIASIERQEGHVDAVIHTAGVLADALIPLKSRASAMAVLAPKVTATWNLHRALANRPLAFWVNCSSVSALVGLPGQVDYAAANAFLDAFSQWRTDHHGVTVAINWGAWRDVGMLAAPRDTATTGADAADQWQPLPAGPFSRVDDRGTAVTYARDRAPDSDWVLDEHRLLSGVAVLPGAAYVDLAVSAAQLAFPSQRPSVGDLFLLTPLATEAPRELRVSIDRAAGDLVIASRSPDGRSVVEHARATVSDREGSTTSSIDVQAILARCTGPVKDAVPNLRHLRIGSRWTSTTTIHLGTDEACATVILPDECHGDLATSVLHPALLDIGTSFALWLIPGYDPGTDFYVPMSYGAVRVAGRLGTRIFCHARRVVGGSDNPDLATFDVTLASDAGDVICRVDHFVTRKLAAGIGLSAAGPAPSTGGLQVNLDNAITPAEGAAAFAAVLGAMPVAQIAVSPTGVSALRAAERHGSITITPSGRAGVRTPMVEPRTDLERQIASIWSNVLGIEQIGIDDNFFELGGHSLLLTQVGARLRRLVGGDIALASLFEHPTIRGTADQCGKRPTRTVDEPALVAVPRERLRRPKASVPDETRS